MTSSPRATPRSVLGTFCGLRPRPIRLRSPSRRCGRSAAAGCSDAWTSIAWHPPAGPDPRPRARGRREQRRARRTRPRILARGKEAQSREQRNKASTSRTHARHVAVMGRPSEWRARPPAHARSAPRGEGRLLRPVDASTLDRLGGSNGFSRRSNRRKRQHSAARTEPRGGRRPRGHARHCRSSSTPWWR